MTETLSRIVPPLIAWYDRCARILPWREDPAPYRVWVSEVMLQQTRVETVKPYFARFLRELPDVAALAAAPEAQLLKLWEGLGYYSRVRNLQKGARAVTERFGGVIPGDFDALLTLPGIGRYTAGAIASIAFGVPVPAVDGNVLRVTARLLDCHDPVTEPAVKRRIEDALKAVIPADRPGTFNQGLMELGATVCLPNGAPKCEGCPLSALCLGRERGTAEVLPVKAAKKPRRIEERTVFLLTCRGRIGLRRRPEKGLLAGLWELPALPGALDREEAAAALSARGIVAVPEPLPGAKHIFTHLEWHMRAWAAECPEELPGLTWADREELREIYTLPSAFSAYFGEIEKRL